MWSLVAAISYENLVFQRLNIDGFSCLVSTSSDMGGKARLAGNGRSPLQELEY